MSRSFGLDAPSALETLRDAVERFRDDDLNKDLARVCALKAWHLCDHVFAAPGNRASFPTLRALQDHVKQVCPELAYLQDICILTTRKSPSTPRESTKPDIIGAPSPGISAAALIFRASRWSCPEVGPSGSSMPSIAPRPSGRSSFPPVESSETVRCALTAGTRSLTGGRPLRRCHAPLRPMAKCWPQRTGTGRKQHRYCRSPIRPILNIRPRTHKVVVSEAAVVLGRHPNHGLTSQAQLTLKRDHSVGADQERVGNSVDRPPLDRHNLLLKRNHPTWAAVRIGRAWTG